MTPTDIPQLIADLRNYSLTLDENTVICDRRAVDQSASIMLAMAADLGLRDSNLSVCRKEASEICHQYISDLRRPPAGDSTLRRIERIEKFLSKWSN